MSVVGWTLAAVLAAAASRPPTVTEIMARVAANQRAASDARRHFDQPRYEHKELDFDGSMIQNIAGVGRKATRTIRCGRAKR